MSLRHSPVAKSMCLNDVNILHKENFRETIEYVTHQTCELQKLHNYVV